MKYPCANLMRDETRQTGRVGAREDKSWERNRLSAGRVIKYWQPDFMLDEKKTKNRALKMTDTVISMHFHCPNIISLCCSNWRTCTCLKGGRGGGGRYAMLWYHMLLIVDALHSADTYTKSSHRKAEHSSGCRNSPSWYEPWQHNKGNKEKPQIQTHSCFWQPRCTFFFFWGETGGSLFFRTQRSIPCRHYVTP